MPPPLPLPLPPLPFPEPFALPLPCLGDAVGEATACVDVEPVDPLRVWCVVWEPVDAEVAPDVEELVDLVVGTLDTEPPASPPARPTVTEASCRAVREWRAEDAVASTGTTTAADAPRVIVGVPATSGMPSRLIPTPTTPASNIDDATATSTDADNSPPRERTAPPLVLATPQSELSERSAKSCCAIRTRDPSRGRPRPVQLAPGPRNRGGEAS